MYCYFLFLILVENKIYNCFQIPLHHNLPPKIHLLVDLFIDTVPLHLIDYQSYLINLSPNLYFYQPPGRYLSMNNYYLLDLLAKNNLKLILNFSSFQFQLVYYCYHFFGI